MTPWPLPLQVREAWQTYELEMINYQNKCRIIRGWDDLFTKCKEHLNSVAAMKLSPYYKVDTYRYTPIFAAFHCLYFTYKRILCFYMHIRTQH